MYCRAAAGCRQCPRGRQEGISRTLHSRGQTRAQSLLYETLPNPLPSINQSRLCLKLNF